MFGYIFRTGTYYLLWKKFKKQLITLIISAILLILIFSIYNDLFIVLKIANKESVIGLLFLKWFLVISIVVFNIFNFKRIKIEKAELEHQEVKTKPKPIYHEKIL